MKGVVNIRNTIFNHFESHFKFRNVDRLGVDNLNFKSLSVMNRGDLVKLVSLKKVKHAIWDYKNFKSSGSDGINFGFTKNFWVDLKDDLMYFFFFLIFIRVAN